MARLSQLIKDAKRFYAKGILKPCRGRFQADGKCCPISAAVYWNQTRFRKLSDTTIVDRVTEIYNLTDEERFNLWMGVDGVDANSYSLQDPRLDLSSKAYQAGQRLVQILNLTDIRDA